MKGAVSKSVELKAQRYGVLKTLVDPMALTIRMISEAQYILV